MWRIVLKQVVREGLFIDLIFENLVIEIVGCSHIHTKNNPEIFTVSDKLTKEQVPAPNQPQTQGKQGEAVDYISCKR